MPSSPVGAVTTKAATRSKRLAYSEILIGDFSGGLNLRDALTELANNETPDCLNVVLDERGAAHKRLGFVKWNATPISSTPTTGYESDVCSCVLWYTKANGNLYRDLGGILTVVENFATGGNVEMVDFAGACYLIHSIDGLFSSTDGASWTQVLADTGTVPDGDLLAVWQNKLWVASSESNLLSFCAPGDTTKWDSADDAGTNYIREGNDYPIVCLYGTSGTDSQAQPALIVGKRSGSEGSLHRVIDAGSGDFRTIDQNIGPAGRDSITSLYGQIYFISTEGIFTTDGQTTIVPISAKLARLFRRDTIDFSRAPAFLATRTRDRIRFALSSLGSPVNDICLEFHPGFDAFTLRSDAAAIWVVHGQEDGILLGASPTSTGQILQYDVGGADDGAPIESRLLTKVFEPGGGYPQRLQHIRILGRGHVTIESIADFAQTGKQKLLSMLAEGFTWDSDGWDDPNIGWGEDVVEGWADFWPRQLGRAFQMKFTESGTSVGSEPPVANLPSISVGSWAAYALHLTITPLHPYG